MRGDRYSRTAATDPVVDVQHISYNVAYESERSHHYCRCGIYSAFVGPRPFPVGDRASGNCRIRDARHVLAYRLNLAGFACVLASLCNRRWRLGSCRFPRLPVYHCRDGLLRLQPMPMNCQTTTSGRSGRIGLNERHHPGYRHSFCTAIVNWGKKFRPSANGGSAWLSSRPAQPSPVASVRQSYAGSCATPVEGNHTEVKCRAAARACHAQPCRPYRVTARLRAPLRVAN